ncbi:MAG: hypothetical protein HQ512_13000 [Rhodospirillales bacterium]|nr:hypothetical protein [Rhodospirillales bacterium]
MHGYLGNFIEHWGQVSSFAQALAVWLGFSALGVWAGGPNRISEATPIYGWAVLSIVFTVFGVFTPVPFTYLAVAMAVLAVLAAVLAIRRGIKIFPDGSFRIAVLVLPLLLMVSAMIGSQWDEFADWLISPRFILELDTFPDNSNKARGGTLAGYPYGWHFVTYLASRMAGRLVENAGALVNVFMLLGFGLLNIRMIREGQGEPVGPSGVAAPGWGLLAVGALSATLLNPTFVQKVALTSYADVATAVCVGFGGVLGWYMLAALARGDRKDAGRLAWQIGLVMMVLVNLKQATVILHVITVGAILLAGLRDPEIKFPDLARTVPAMVVPGIIIFAVWRYHLATALTGAEMSFQPFDQWLFGHMGEILWKMLVVLSKKGAYLGLMAVASFFAIRALIRFRTPFDRLAIIAGAAFLGYNAFLFFTYVAAFGRFDGLRVASLWRYNMHLGLLGVAFAAYGIGMIWKRQVPESFKEKKRAWVAIALILIAPFAFAKKIRFDRHPPVPHFRTVSAALKGMLKPGDKVFVVDPLGSGESAVITRFDLGGEGIYGGYTGLYHPTDAKRFRSIFARPDLTHLLVHSSTPILRDVSGQPFAAGKSYLLAGGAGNWKIIKTWDKPGNKPGK